MTDENLTRTACGLTLLGLLTSTATIVGVVNDCEPLACAFPIFALVVASVVVSRAIYLLFKGLITGDM